MVYNLGYCIERREFGYLVKSVGMNGGVPIEAFSDVEKLLPKKSAVMDAGIAHSLRQTEIGEIVFVACPNGKAAEEWRERIERELESKFPADTPQRWFLGTDVGASSATIFFALTKYEKGNPVSSHYFGVRIGSTPQDIDDFGRCYRFMKRFRSLDFDARIAEVGELFPAWIPFVNSWAALCDAYSQRERDPKGTLQAEIDKLNKQGGKR